MRVLLDTNIIIYRENKKMTNYSIGHLFRWLDKLKYDKLIHPLTKKRSLSISMLIRLKR